MSRSTDTVPAKLQGTEAGERLRPSPHLIAAGLMVLAAGALLVGQATSVKQSALLLLGASLGLVLYHAAFGFASAWRAFLTDGRGAGLRAQMLMLAVTTAIFLPLLSGGAVFGQPVVGAIAPVGVSVFCGALVFGIGMQLGGGCASGTLYGLGGGSTRLLMTLVFFMLGSLIGSAHFPWWLEMPSLGAISLSEELGVKSALALQLLLFAVIAVASWLIERHRHGHSIASPAGSATWGRLLRGPWPLLAGAVALALLNVVTLGMTGHPWTISFGYTLWGAEIAGGLGVDVAAWEFWTWSFPARALKAGVLADATSVMNFGIIAGAFLAAALAGRFKPVWRLSWRALTAAALGGLLMGYGARLAFGCNVGAYFSGIASGSLHGWLWFISALLGTYLGLRLRPRFGLDRAP